MLIAHDLSPADMLQFKKSVFAGFVTDVGGRTSHTAIVARSMDIPAVVGARSASQLVRQDDWVIIDGDAGVVIVDPSPIILAEYGFKQRQGDLERGRLSRLRHKPAVTLDGQRVDLLANIEMPEDTLGAVKAGAVGVGLFRSEFLFMGREAQRLTRLPDEEEQYQAYKRAVEGMQGMPVTIRTIDVGADKPLDGKSVREDSHLNPALGLRAIRWSLADPAMFLTQLRAILRAAAHGEIHLLIPMLAHASEIRQTLSLVDFARAELDNRGVVHGNVKLGAMIEIPAAALTLQDLPEALRLPVDRHQRPDPVHAGDRPRRRVGGAPVRPGASRGAAPGGRHHRRVPAPGQGRERVRRDGGRRRVHAPAAGPGPAQLLDAPVADPGGQAGGAARRHEQARSLGAGGARGRGSGRACCMAPAPAPQ